MIALLLWRPGADQLAVFFVFSGLWGMADAVWQTQNNGESPAQAPSWQQEGSPWPRQLWGLISCQWTRARRGELREMGGPEGCDVASGSDVFSLSI